MEKRKSVFPIGGVLLIVSAVLFQILNMILFGSLAGSFFQISIIFPVLIGLFIVLKQNKIAGCVFFAYAVAKIFSGMSINFYNLLGVFVLIIMGIALFFFFEKQTGMALGIVAGVITIIRMLYLNISGGRGWQFRTTFSMVMYAISYILIGIWVSKPFIDSTKVINSISPDELLKLKELLDAGVITQEEFEIKKKQLM